MYSNLGYCVTRLAESGEAREGSAANVDAVPLSAHDALSLLDAGLARGPGRVVDAELAGAELGRRLVDLRDRMEEDTRAVFDAWLSDWSEHRTAEEQRLADQHWRLGYRLGASGVLAELGKL